MRRAYWLALAVALAGCGGEPAPPSAAVRTVDRYLDAVAERDYAAACEQLSKDERGGNCAEVLSGAIVAVPDEFLLDAADAKTELGPVNGKKVDVLVRSTGAFSSQARTSTAPMELQDGEWKIVELPQSIPEDPVTSCIASSIGAFENGETDTYWSREGRRDFVEYSRRLCKALVKAGLDPEESSVRQIAPYAGRVIRGLIREGRVERP